MSEPAFAGACHLKVEFAQHLIFCVFMVEVTEVDKSLMHRLVSRQCVCILHSFPHNVAILILYNNHLHSEMGAYREPKQLLATKGAA